MRDLNELKFIYPHGVRKCDVLGEHPPMSMSNDSDYVKTVLVTSICADINSSSRKSTHDQYNIDHFQNSNGNYSNNLIANAEPYSLNSNYQQYNVYNTFRNSNNITSSIYDFNCSKSTTNHIQTDSSFHDNKEFSSSEAHDSSTESFVVGNAITSSVNLLASDNYYYQICD